MASAVARAYNGAAGSRGSPPRQGAKPPEAESFFAFGRPRKSGRISCIDCFSGTVRIYIVVQKSDIPVLILR